MIIRDGFYHADPHPGNFLLLPGLVVGVIDCGMVGRIDDQLREVFEDMLLYLLRRDSEGLAELLMRAGSAPPETDRASFRADVIEADGGEQVWSREGLDAADGGETLVLSPGALAPGRYRLEVYGTLGDEEPEFLGESEFEVVVQ